MKNCSNKNCTQVNPQVLNEFTKDSRNSDGLQSQCKTCKYASNKKWESANPEKILAYNKSAERIARHKETTYAWRARNKDKYNAYMRQKNKEAYPEARFQRYGVTKEWYEKTLEEQNHSCAICKKPNQSTKRSLAVDHEHSSGKIRGIVCYNCNRALHAFDNVDLYALIMEYLKKHKEAA